MENSDQESLAGEREGVVTARGTGDGLVIRLDGSVDPLALREALAEFLASRRSFLGGNEVALEWVGAVPEQAMIDALSEFVRKEFQITVKESRFRDLHRAGEAAKESAFDGATRGAASPIVSVRSLRSSDKISPSLGAVPGKQQLRNKKSSSLGGSALVDSSDEMAAYRAPNSDTLTDHTGGWGERSKKVSLFDGIDVMNIPDDEGDAVPRSYSGGDYTSDSSSSQRAKAFNPLLWDDPDARIVNMTLRSGQKVESDHSVIIRGDVNSGAEVIAGGDIIVLGTLRGIAHAGAFDDTGGGRSIVALSLQPTQLRIGSLISRGKSETGASEAGQGIEIARIEGNIIAVEPYQVRGANRRT
jgi:septum site-determining protein MinC